jgi:hypothetical protein
MPLFGQTQPFIIGGAVVSDPGQVPEAYLMDSGIYTEAE